MSQTQKYPQLIGCTAPFGSRFYFLLILLFSKVSAYGQLSPRADAYKIFSGQTVTFKAGYLDYPLLAGTIDKWKNVSCASHQIVCRIVLQEVKGVKDTVAKSKFNSAGFIIERDSIFRIDVLKCLEKLTYEYKLTENVVTQTRELLAINRKDSLINRDITVFYYNKDGFLSRKEFFRGVDSSYYWYENDTIGIIHAIKYNNIGFRDTVIERYNYKYDARNRISSVAIQRFTLNLSKESRFPDTFYHTNSHQNTTNSYEYNDTIKRVSCFNRDKCIGTFYFYRDNHVVENYCCPANEAFFRQERRETYFEDSGKITSQKTYSDFGLLCYRRKPIWNLAVYKYNEIGLLKEIEFGKEKIYFHYL